MSERAQRGVRDAVAEQERLPPSGLLIYALAAVGGVIGYVPLLTLLLPIKVYDLGVDRYGVLAWCGVAGATAAALANVAFGWLGDRSVAAGGGRRRWLIAGAAATMVSFVGVAGAQGMIAIVASIVLFQVAVNAVLAQVGALIAEEIPAAQKGVVAAMLTLGNPVATGVCALAVAGVDDGGGRLAIVAAAMAACLLPLALARARGRGGHAEPPSRRGVRRRGLATAWAAQLLMQVATSAVGLYLLFYFPELTGGQDRAAASVARLLVAAAVLPVPIALVLGRWSDRVGRRTPFLAAMATLATVGLFGMATAGSWTMGAASYVGFATGGAVFIALNTGHAMLLLPDPARTGRDLGLLNLANTLPQIVAPLLAWWSATAHDFGATMMVLAALTTLAGLVPLLLERTARPAAC